MADFKTIRPLTTLVDTPDKKVRQSLLDNRPAKELFSSEEVELHFKSERFKAIARRRSAQDALDGLNAALLAHVITGLELVRLERHLNEIVRKSTNRLRMLRLNEDMAEKQRIKEGSAWV